METYLHALTSYFVIIDPIGTAVVFYSLTGTGDKNYSVRMAFRAVIISVMIVLLFGFFGQAFLARLGISIEALRVAGGLLLFYTAFHMITRQNSSDKKGTDVSIDISVYPLSIPLIAGPGCLTLTILLFSGRGESSTTPLVLAVLSIYLLTLAAFLGARAISRLIGETGDDIIRRLLGVILAALAIQFIADGIRQIIAGN